MRRLLLPAFMAAFATFIAAPVVAGASPSAVSPEIAPPQLRAVRRVALVVGANRGGSERAELRYAHSDAETLAEVLGKLGGVAPSDIVRLHDPTPQKLRAAFDELEKRAPEHDDDTTVQFLFYYSGHSDERGLLLGEQRVDYPTLRAWIDDVSADVRIAILDSCASGAFTRLKGGVKTAPFLAASLTDVKGHAFLTSSSENEAAQESDRVGGSFFTHYFTTGLRGAADANGDRLITLNEAYRFAFDETLARTEATQGGPQHAAYEIQLTGSGDLVMTDLRRRTGHLEISSAIEGRISIRNEKGFLAAELVKAKTEGPMHLALEPGEYRVMVDDGEHRWVAHVELTNNEPVALGSSRLVLVPSEQTVARGGPSDVPEELHPLHRVPIDASLVPSISLNARSRHPRTLNKVSFGALANRSTVVRGASIALGLSMVDERLDGIQLGFIGNLNRGATYGVQWSMGANMSDMIRGAQIAPVNHAREVQRGVQIGVVNHASTSAGGQIGALNMGGRGSSIQIGLVNVARQANAQLGLFSVTREGNVHPEIWTSDTGLIHIGIRLPARYTYSMVALAISPIPGTSRSFMIGSGFGGHIPLPHALFLDIGMVHSIVSSDLESYRNWAYLGQLRLLFGWNPRPRISVFGGPTLNVMLDRLEIAGYKAPVSDAEGTTPPPGGTPRPGYKWVQYDSQASTARVRAWVGFAVGLRF